MKFNLDFDNIVKMENLRGEYEVNHEKYLSDKLEKCVTTESNIAEGHIIFNEDNYLKITNENNKIRNKRRYKTIVDRIELDGFNCKYIILIYSLKDIDYGCFTVWKHPTIDKSDKEYTECDNIMERTFCMNKQIYICIRDKEFLDENSKFVIKDSIGRTYNFIVNEKPVISESRCFIKDNEYYSLLFSASEKDEINRIDKESIFNHNEFSEFFIIDKPDKIGFLYKNIFAISTIDILLVINGKSFFIINYEQEVKEDGITYIYLNEGGYNFDDIYVKNILGEEYMICDRKKPKLI